MAARMLGLALIFVLLAPPLLAPSPVGAGAGPERIVVMFGPSLPQNASDLVRQAGGTVVDTLPELGILVAEAIGTAADRIIGQLQQTPGVFHASKDVQLALVRNPVSVNAASSTSADDLYTSGQQWSIVRVGATPTGAWSVSKGKGSVIAILDTGVSSTHPDIQPNLVLPSKYPSIPANCPVPSGSGFSFIEGESAEDMFGHGTWVASIAAGAQGGGRVIGVAPQAGILNIKIVNQWGGTSASLIVQGIKCAADLGADVINLSVGGLVDKSTNEGIGFFLMMDEAAKYATKKGSVIVAAAGNFPSVDMDASKGCAFWWAAWAATPCVNGDWAFLPAQLPNVIAAIATTNPTVQATNSVACDPISKDCLAFYTNYGKSLNGLSAPGGDGATEVSGIFGACNGSWWFCSGQDYIGVQFGTSASTPHIAGAAALLRSMHPRLPAKAVRFILERTAQDLGAKGNDQIGRTHV